MRLIWKMQSMDSGKNLADKKTWKQKAVQKAQSSPSDALQRGQVESEANVQVKLRFKYD